MKIEKTPTTTGRCWNCGLVNSTHLLPGVRRILCPNSDCRAVHPCETEEEFRARKNQYGLNARVL